MEETTQLLRRNLKVLLLHLAAKSDNPSGELKDIVQDVIAELHQEVKQTIRTKSSLRLISTPIKASTKS